MEQIDSSQDMKVIMATLRLMNRYSDKRRPRNDTQSLVKSQPQLKPAEQSQRQHKRLSFSANIQIISEEIIQTGEAKNVSLTGIFVETTENLFSVGQVVQLSISPKGSTEEFKAVASITHTASSPCGYGMKFSTI